ncbi:sodium- and chloride-dependent glycine transporter 2-like [Pectinophora gossypiella]|uniref:sodium- and chloride-dependent glycine transporter 2-like n=1 Tax=Pectinophora gossypiella TaxID=13191 RepID=UPI00214F192D|nr:sodium- and chloride-dependent glycine transporter 2-like [Pectinophora gossypiella]
MHFLSWLCKPILERQTLPHTLQQKSPTGGLLSVCVSSRTKSVVSESRESDSSTSPLAIDRWTNNITYRQLVVSSCIGIVQLWWHPYVHDMHKLLPFLFLYNVFSVLIGYPLFYLELALGVVTKKGVLNCWDLSPMARGLGFSMLVTCMYTALAVGTVATWCLALLVHSFHAFLPWLHCAASAQPACAARHRPMPPASETPAQSFFFNFVLRLKRDGLDTGTGTFVPELCVYYIICWLLIYGIAIKRIYSYSKMVLFKDVMAYFILICCALGALRLDGASRMFQDADWSCLLNDFQIWREAIEHALLEMSIAQGTLVMLGAYCPKQQHMLARTALVSFAASKTSSMSAALTLGAAHGALIKDYENATNIQNGSAASIILWADYVARIPGSQFWSALIFFTLFVLSLSSAALLVQTIMSTFKGRSIRKIAWAFLILICALFCLIGVITVCTQGGLHILNFLMKWPVTKPRVLIAAIGAFVVTFAYGQTTFCEDVYFAVGEYPCVFLRICWAISPGLLLCVFLLGMGLWPPADAVAGWVLVVISTMPIFAIMVLYLIFKFRVRNIVGTEK